ncbi:MAG TPA: hypothetical protein VJK71_03275 [Gemmatimonadales bacterium]|nr:hypothetical protein [Gemmatimonadales bacterium]
MVIARNQRDLARAAQRLNFRLCGSTPGLLWFDAAARRRVPAVTVAKSPGC